MPATTTVLYPKGAKFDMDYYIATHMPLVAKKWTEYGLKSWKVIKFPEDAAYLVQATLEWGSIDNFNAAASSESAGEVLGDVKNFTDSTPVLISGDEVATS